MYKLGNEISVPKRLDSAVAEGMQRVHKIHRSQIFRKASLFAAGIGLFFTAFLIWGFRNPVLASQIPLVGKLFAKVQQNVTYSGDYTEKVHDLDHPIDNSNRAEKEENKYSYTSSDGAYTFEAKEFYSDGLSVYIGMQIKKEEGFGKIAELPTDAYGDTMAQTIMVYGGSVEVNGKNTAEISTIPIEGVQTDENTFEGMIKIDLDALERKQDTNFDLTLNLNHFIYWDKLLMEQQNADSSEGEPVQFKYSERGEWNISIPVVVDTSEVYVFDVNDSMNQIGIESVTVTPYEIKIKTLLPPIYANELELTEAKREQAKQDGYDVEKMSDAEINELVWLAKYNDYGAAVFDENGTRFEAEAAIETENGIEVSYSVKSRQFKQLYIYIGKDGIACFKETNKEKMEGRALYQRIIDL